MSRTLIQRHLTDFEDLTHSSIAIEVGDAAWRDGLTLHFWFWAAAAERRQVIVREESDAWTIAIEGSSLIFESPALDGERLALLIHGEGWHLAALTRDLSGVVHFSLDGVHRTAAQRLSAEAAARLGRLIVGGHTDPAGGHWDHSFGRGGSGLIDDFRAVTPALSEAEIAALLPQPGDPPNFQMDIDPPAGDAPLEVRLTAAQRGGNHAIAFILWDFGDGAHGSGEQTMHRYDYAGEYTVRLTVINTAHRQSSAEARLILGGRADPLHFAPVFINGTEGYACYRIPSIVRALNGDLLAFAEARLESCSDSTGTIRIVSKRSPDDGATWSPLQVVAAVKGFVAMNAAPVVDDVRGTGRVVLVFRAASHSEWDIARGVGVSRAMCVISGDHGATWSAPRDITAQVHKPYNPTCAADTSAAALPENRAEDWRIQIPSQGHALQLRRRGATRGRLFFAGSLTRGDRSIFQSENYAFWSDDLGETWQIGGIIPRLGLNEAIAAELEDGGVIFNTRAYTPEGHKEGRRAITRADFDATGAIQFGETILDATLIDPAVQATLLRCTWSDQTAYGGRSRLLFANPAHPTARVRMTVRLSYDEGRTWAHSRVIDRGPSSYSDLVMICAGQIGLLYERGNTGGIYFARFSLDWLTGGADTLGGQTESDGTQ
ncbi:MAG: exo-alpha-sialidase [Anaerolineae bacterium]|nr:exo-alpha-sialidase [Anaerolineae bacterium]NUQ03080.1 exo-alpha-sialidase [Anaerolineae bacterium]